MKKLLLIANLLFTIMTVAYSQDIIYKKNGDLIKAKVMEITSLEIKYKEFDFAEGPVFSIAKSEVSQIIYESGLKEKFESSKDKKSSFSKFEQGQTDAQLYYRGGTGAATGTVVTTIMLGPFGGLICATVCASVTPSINSLGITDQKLLNNPDYLQGYQMTAKKMRSRKIWRGYLITNGVILVGVVGGIIIYNMSINH